MRSRTKKIIIDLDSPWQFLSAINWSALTEICYKPLMLIAHQSPWYDLSILVDSRTRPYRETIIQKDSTTMVLKGTHMICSRCEFFMKWNWKEQPHYFILGRAKKTDKKERANFQQVEMPHQCCGSERLTLSTWNQLHCRTERYGYRGTTKRLGSWRAYCKSYTLLLTTSLNAEELLTVHQLNEKKKNIQFRNMER